MAGTRGKDAMAANKSAPGRFGRRTMRGERIKDEVYRQMFFLEESRPGSQLGLALALLRAWQAADTISSGDEERDWLKKVSPICLKMIEAGLPSCGINPSMEH